MGFVFFRTMGKFACGSGLRRREKEWFGGGGMCLRRRFAGRRKEVLFLSKEKALAYARALQRMMGIEPTSKAWEAFILPMNYIRKYFVLNYYSINFKFVKRDFAKIYAGLIASALDGHTKYGIFSE